MGQTQAYTPTADIAVSRFVAIDTAGGDYSCKQAVVADVNRIVGISHEGPFYATLPGDTIGPAMVTGHASRIYGDGEQCLVTSGAAFADGTLLTTDANGKAVAAAADAAYVARANRTATAADELIEVTIIMGGQLAT